MKVIDTKGINYLEKFDTSAEWYWGTDYACGDLYEAEEVADMGERFEPNRLIFVHYPDGKVYEPIERKENQYFGTPAYVEDSIYLLLAHFDERILQLLRWSAEMEALEAVTEISLDDIKDCYNLRIDGSPLMLTRQGKNNVFQIIWPEKVEFAMESTEGFLFRENDELIFSQWYEDPDYRETVNVREYPSGKLIRKLPGGLMTMPNNEKWILG